MRKKNSHGFYYFLESFVDDTEIKVHFIVKRGVAVLAIGVHNHDIINENHFVASVYIESDDVFSIRVIYRRLRESSFGVEDIFDGFLIFVDNRSKCGEQSRFFY